MVKKLLNILVSKKLTKYFLQNWFTLGNPLVLKKLQVDRQNRQDGSARCMKVCPNSGELDWLLDWFFDDDDDEDCIYMCDITINALNYHFKGTNHSDELHDIIDRWWDRRNGLPFTDKNKTFDIKNNAFPA